MCEEPCFILTVFESSTQPLVSHLAKSIELGTLLSYQRRASTLIQFTAPPNTIRECVEGHLAIADFRRCVAIDR